MKHDFVPATSLSSNCESVSVGIYPLVPTKDGLRAKKGKVVVRVKGPASEPGRVNSTARKIAEKLDAGTYAGPKTVWV